MRRPSNTSRLTTLLPAAWIALICMIPFFPSGAAAQPSLTAKAILEMSPIQSSKGVPVQLRGVVTEAVEQGLVVHDGTAGVWVYLDNSENFHPGDLIQLNGATANGKFAPVINAGKVTRVGTAPLPRPIPADYLHLSSGDLDGQYVTVQGTVRSVGVLQDAPSSKRLRVTLKMKEDGLLTVTLPENNLDAVQHLIDAEVRITGTALCSKNDSGQIIAPALATDGLHNITVTRPPPGDLFSLPLVPLGRLMQYRSGTNYGERVHVSGTVTYFKPGERVILENGGAALYVNTIQTEPLKPGDRVEAVGFPAPRASGPILDDAVLRRDAAGPAPLPTAVAVGDVCTGQLNYNLINVQSHLLREIREPARDVLLLQEGSKVIVAELENAPPGTLPDLEAGSTLAVTGINTLEVGGSWNYGTGSAQAVRCTLLLRQAADARVLSPPSWWSARHMSYIAVALGLLAFVFLLQALASRSRRWRLQAVMNERERIAHEMHDTLAQSFAGIGFQLQAIQRSVPESLPHLRQQVSLATDLVRHSHKEARRSFEPLQVERDQTVNLFAELEHTARQMLDGGPMQLTVAATGTPVAIPPRVAKELLRIGQEAVANTVRHSSASRLDIILHFKTDAISLRVEDNGVGFVKSGDLLGFGLRGMRKRAASINAKLEIDSTPGRGTRIEALVQLPSRLSSRNPFNLAWNYLRSTFLNVDPQR